MLPLIHAAATGLFETIRIVLGPLGFLVGGSLLVLLGWSLWSAIRDSMAIAQQMHKIPCANCQFYTGDHRLKCPVHPTEAASEEAIGCRDYQPTHFA